MTNLSEIKFIDAATTATISKEFDNYKGSLITIQANGDATSASFKIEGRADINADWIELAMVNLKDFSTTTTISNKDIYQTSIEGITQIRVNLLAVSGGNITIFGRATN